MALTNGSEKQIAWATDIRERIIEEMQQYRASIENTHEDADKAYVDEAIEKVSAVANTQWWIDARQSTGSSLIANYLLHGERSLQTLRERMDAQRVRR